MNGDEIIKRAMIKLPDPLKIHDLQMSVLIVFPVRNAFYVNFEKKYSQRFQDIYWQLVSITK